MLRVIEEANETEKNVGDEKLVGEEEATDANKETLTNETKEKEPEDKVAGGGDVIRGVDG